MYPSILRNEWALFDSITFLWNLVRWCTANRRERTKAPAPNEAWSVDFVADQLADGRKLRALTIVDVFTRESLAIEVGQRLKGTDVVRVLSRIGSQRAAPKTLYCGNGTEFTSQVMYLWAYRARRDDPLFAARKADRQRVYRILQRNVSVRVLGRPLVRNTGGGETGDRSMASGI